jgi:peptide/nickel transport system substrate-binding protein
MPTRTMKSPFQRHRNVFAAALVVAWTAAGAAAQEPQRGGTINTTMNSLPRSLLNQVDQGGYKFAVGAKVNEPLVDIDQNWNYKPRLAKSWTTSKDGLTWTFKLRTGVKWQDGKPFVPSDVVWNMENVWKKVWVSPALDAVKSAEASGPDTVVFHLSRPIAPDVFLATLSQRAYVLAPQGFVGTTLRKSPENEKPTGTGPFRVASYVHGQYVVLEKNPDYWDKGKPYVDKIVYKMMVDPETRASALRAGQVDLVPLGSLPLAETEAAKKNPNLVVSSKGFEGNVWYTGLVFNLLKPYTGNQKVRYAIAHAIDMKKFVDLVFLGLGKPMGTAFPDTAQNYTPDVQRYAYNVAEANRLLDETGFPRGKDGVRFTLKMLGSSGNPGVMERSSQFLTQAMKQVGIKLDAEVPDFVSYLRRVYKQRDFDIDLYTAVYLVDPCISTLIWYTSEAYRSGDYYRNHSGLQDAKVDEAADKGCTALDPKVRAESLREFQRLVASSLSILNLVQEERPNVYNKRLHNVGAGSVNWQFSSGADLWLSH